MEEVDGIILVQLRQIGAGIPEEVTTIKTLEVEMLVDGCARCINAIVNDEEKKLPTKLPKGMSARFRVGTEMANAVKELGYMTEIGYNTFLYSNEAEARQLLMWLVERLPKEASEATLEVLGLAALFNRQLAKNVGSRLGSVWTPPYCKASGVAWHGGGAGKKAAARTWVLEGTEAVVNFHAVPVAAPVGALAAAETSAETASYYADVMPLVTAQPPLKQNVAASILEAGARSIATAKEWDYEWETDGVKSGLSPADFKAKKRGTVRTKMSNLLRAAKLRSEAEAEQDQDMMGFLNEFADADLGDSKFRNQEKMMYATEEVDESAPKAATEEELQQQRDEELAAQQAKVDEISAKLAELTAGIKKLTTGLASLEDKTATLDKDNAEGEEKYKVRKKVLDFLPNADENIAKLQGVVDSSTKRLIAVAGKWEARRAELLKTFRLLRRAQTDADGDAATQMDEIKVVRTQMKAVAEQAKSKDLAIKQLNAQYEKMDKGASRSSYTRKILAIVKNIQKQRDEIVKVIADTAVLQRERNAVEEKLGRTYHLTDEMIFKDAKEDVACRKAYKFLAGIHEDCHLLVECISQTAVVTKEMKELQELVEDEQKKKMSANAARIAHDLKAMKKENQSVAAQIKESMA